MKRLCALLIACLLALPAVSLAGRTITRIAAVVNEEIITTHQLDREVEKRLAESGREAKPEGERMKALRHEVLSALVGEVLVEQRARQLGLAVTDEEIEAAIEDVQKQNELSREQLLEALEFQGMPFELYRENMRQQILRYKLLGREVQAKVDVTTQEVRDYFREHIDEYREEPTMRLSRITFPIPEKATNVQIEAVRRLADEAAARLDQGEDFYAVLLSYSSDQRAQGGDMGLFAEGELTPAFDRAVRDLAEGEVSGVVKTPEGVHLLQLVERSPGSIRKFDAVRLEIRDILRKEKTEQRYREWSEGLKKDAYIDIRL